MRIALLVPVPRVSGKRRCWLGVVFARLRRTWRKLKFGSGEAWSARKRWKL